MVPPTVAPTLYVTVTARNDSGPAMLAEAGLTLVHVGPNLPTQVKVKDRVEPV
jgi:hypothetical protein